MKRKTLSPGGPILLLLVSLISAHPVAQAAIDFDDATDGTVINTRYPSVTFTNPIGGNIYARDGSGFAPSSPNVVSVFATGLPPFDARYGGVQARFSTPVRVGWSASMLVPLDP